MAHLTAVDGGIAALSIRCHLRRSTAPMSCSPIYETSVTANRKSCRECIGGRICILGRMGKAVSASHLATREMLCSRDRAINSVGWRGREVA